MEHLVAEGGTAEVVLAAALELQVERVYALAVDVHIAVVDAPLVWPQQVAPTGVGALHNKADVVHLAVVVHIQIERRRYGRVDVDIVHRPLQQAELARAALRVVLIAVGVGSGVVGHIVVARQRVLIRDNVVAVGRRVVVGGYPQLAIRNGLEVVVHRGGSGCRVVEHSVDGRKRRAYLRVVAEADKDDHVVHHAVVAARGFGGTLGLILLRHVEALLALKPGRAVHAHIGRQTHRCWVYTSGHIVGGHNIPALSVFRSAHFALGGVHPPAGAGILHNCIACLVVKAVIILVACQQATQCVAVWLYAHGRRIEHRRSLAFKAHCQRKNHSNDE